MSTPLAFIRVGSRIVNLNQITGCWDWHSRDSIGVHVVGSDPIRLHGSDNEEFRGQFQHAIDAGFIRVFEGDSK